MPIQRRRLEDVPVQRVPDRLHHVPEVEPRFLEHGVVQDGGEGEQHRVGRNPGIDDPHCCSSLAGLDPHARAHRCERVLESGHGTPT
jgi:hypothetical protein